MNGYSSKSNELYCAVAVYMIQIKNKIIFKLCITHTYMNTIYVHEEKECAHILI